MRKTSPIYFKVCGWGRAGPRLQPCSSHLPVAIYSGQMGQCVPGQEGKSRIPQIPPHFKLLLASGGPGDGGLQVRDIAWGTLVCWQSPSEAHPGRPKRLAQNPAPDRALGGPLLCCQSRGWGMVVAALSSQPPWAWLASPPCYLMGSLTAVLVVTPAPGPPASSLFFLFFLSCICVGRGRGSGDLTQGHISEARFKKR